MSDKRTPYGQSPLLTDESPRMQQRRFVYDLPLLLCLTLATGFGGFLGSVCGSYWGGRAVFVGGFIGGLLSAWPAARLARAMRLLQPQEVKGAAIGTLVGFLAAATTIVIAMRAFDNPIGPALCSGLIGLGGVVGARTARRNTM